MLSIRHETPRDAGRVRMNNIAAFEQPDEAFMVRILDPTALQVQPASPATGPSSTPSSSA